MRSVFLAADSDVRLQEFFSGNGYQIKLIRTSGIVQEPVSCHPDMFMCCLGSDGDAHIIFCPDIGDVIRQDSGSSFSLFRPGSSSLKRDYPYDIAYNAACTGRYFIHNLRYTDPVLLSFARSSGMKLVDVRQGYAKCSTVIVDEDSIITYDRGLAESCRKAGMDVLTVSPGHVLLPGYDTGFIGGASGCIGDTVYFNGDLTAHPDSEAIISFIEKCGLKVRWFTGRPLTDIGSILYTDY